MADLQQPMMLGEGPGARARTWLWQHFDFDKFRSWVGFGLYPVILRQTVEPDYRDGLARDWNQPGVSVDRHRGYAFQWFAIDRRRDRDLGHSPVAAQGSGVEEKSTDGRENGQPQPAWQPQAPGQPPAQSPARRSNGSCTC